VSAQKVSLEVRKAVSGDVPDIAALVNQFAETGAMLHRTDDELYEALRDFTIVRLDGELMGCAGLHMMGQDLAEIRSLAIREGHQGQGLGRALVEGCLDEARSLGIARVFALTAKPGFFEKLGFRRVERSSFPQKIWRDCYKCRFFEACIEVAVEFDTSA